MSYKSIGVSMALEASNRACLTAAIEIAERFDARVIGMAGTIMPAPLYFTDGQYGEELFKREEVQLRARLASAEEEFRNAVGCRIKQIEWRADLQIAKDFIPAQARSVDLVIVAAQPETDADPYSGTSPSDLVMETGRPILVVPPSTTWFDPRRILVAWKDTRESRRAILDALPFLRRADDVIVVEVCPAADEQAASERVKDVSAWLLKHGVTASTTTVTEVNAPDDLEALASDMNAGLIVAGAYGHSRLRQWVLGGVTRQFVTRPSRCVLLSR